jgi:outer membrane protein OmpA-like peptidoglycan-associated protein
MKIRKNTLLALPLAALIAVPGMAQSSQPQTTDQVQNQVDQKSVAPAQSSSQPAQSSSQASTSAQATSTDTTRQPLELQSKEGFWGKLNPFARKKYVRRQMAPVVGRVNELDELTAANGRNIKDVDARATEGLRLANLKVSEADSHAVDAGNRANLAHQTATQASTRIGYVEGALQNVDQYKPVTEAEIRFRPGQTLLSKKAKAALDEIAEQMKDQKGMIVEVQGFSSGKGSASVQNSQNMASSVVRYLVINHEIPVYRIYTVGMGNAPLKTAEGKNRRISGGRVEVALLRNGIADLNQQMAQSPSAQPESTQPAAPAASSTSGYGVNTNTNLPQGDQPQQKKPETEQKQPVPPQPPSQEPPKSEQPK